MTYSQEDVERIAYLTAAQVWNLEGGAHWENIEVFLDYCVNRGINQFWDEQEGGSDIVTYTINGKQFDGAAGTVMTFQRLAELAEVKNADTCVFKRKRAGAQAGLLRHDQTLKLQGGMAITIVNTGSA